MVVMAALRRIPGSLRPSSLGPSLPLFVSRRGIASKLFVGGLSFYTTQKGLMEAFSKYGQVVEAKIVTDRVSDRSKGFGFVTFASEAEAKKAKAEMDGKPLNGRAIIVNYARPQRFEDGMPIARGPPEPTTDH
ncbi:small RNA-binding protein 11, chloroplastic [Diospyros lotus]|uniref:small RNA-binding protein 11, chloroplastic n=1 Tax=Diospyros lotus TaxID=55363 RepID=UPI002255BB3F|nr:small RNA-binding protein 11, chloroplastic [Diospyros lotus]